MRQKLAFALEPIQSFFRHEASSGILLLFFAALAMALKRPEEGAAFGDERERGEIEEGEVGVVAVGGHVFHGFFTSHFVALFLSADVRSASFSVMCVVTQREMA